MTWLHDWSGLVIGWLLFAIALAGSLAVFRPEIGNWARPEARCCTDNSAAAGASAVRWLSIHAATAPAWYIRPADRRSATTYAAWADPKAPGGFVQTWLNARTGSPAGIRGTLGGEFFYRLHFELQLPYPWGRLLAGAAAIIMFLALITGIIAHRRIFTDFFTFRPGKGQRSWLDAHNLFAVTALPFHIIITFTGALTLSTLLMPWGALSAYGDLGKAGRALNPAAVEREASGRRARLAPLDPILRDAERRFGGGLFDVDVAHPGDAAATVTIIRAEDRRIGLNGAMLSYDGVTGRLLAAYEEARPGVATYNFLYGLHTARFAETLLRWIYFISGLMLTATIGAGLLLWTAKRAGRRRGTGFVLVERLNIGFVGGTPIAFAAFFLANRLLPLNLAGRAAAEVSTVFWCWGAALLFAAMRTPVKAWRDLAVLTALACTAVVVLDVAGGTAAAGVDLTALVIAVGYGVTAWRAHQQSAALPCRGRVQPA